MMLGSSCAPVPESLFLRRHRLHLLYFGSTGFGAVCAVVVIDLLFLR
jgi:hypothetical protein